MENINTQNIFKQFLNQWDLSIESLDDKEQHQENEEMFDFLIHHTGVFKQLIEDKYDQKIINLNQYSKENEKLLLETLEKQKNDKNLIIFEKMQKYLFKLKQDYQKIVTLKNRRTKENINLKANLWK